MNKKIKYLLTVFITIFALFVICVFALFIKIKVGIYAYELRAKKYFPNQNSTVASMILYINDTSQSSNTRNNMIWAIGQKGDKTALPGLLLIYNSPSSSINNELSRYELAKAINRCGGNVPFKMNKNDN